MLTPCSKWLTFQFGSSRFISTSLLCITERSPVSLKTGDPEDPYKRSTVWYDSFSSTNIVQILLAFLALFCHQSTIILNCFFSEPFHLEGQSTLFLCEVTFESYPNSGFTTSSFYIFHLLLPPDLAHFCFHCRNHLPNHF